MDSNMHARLRTTQQVSAITEAEYRLAREERRLAMLRKIVTNTSERPSPCLGPELAEAERRYKLARQARDAIACIAP